MQTASITLTAPAATRSFAAALAGLLVSASLLGAVLLGFDRQAYSAAQLAQQTAAVRIG